MADGYNDAPGEEGHSPLDELMCEYVDGTMDARVREVFEECLCADRDMARQVDQFYQALERLATSRSNETFIELMTEASHLYEAVASSRKVVGAVCQVLQPETVEEPDHAPLALFFEQTATCAWIRAASASPSAAGPTSPSRPRT